MKKLLLLTLLVQLNIYAYSAKITITNSGAAFSPATVNINVGDTVIFQLSSSHNAIEVSQSTYTSNGNTSNSGFAVPFGGGSVTFTNSGTFYYVCEPHASIGMKGIINVSKSAGFSDLDNNSINVIYPNPSKDIVNIEYKLVTPNNLKISIFDVDGKPIKL